MSTAPEELAVAVPAFEPDFDVEFDAEFDAVFQQFQPLDPERFDAPRERHLRAVPPRRRRQPRLGLWIGSVVTVVSLFLLVAFNVFMVQGQFELDRIDQQRAIEQQEYARLRDQVAKLSAPDEIVGKARANGMVESARVTQISAPTAGASAPPRDDTATTQKDTRGGVPLAASP
jgi:hypothetical protein